MPLKRDGRRKRIRPQLVGNVTQLDLRQRASNCYAVRFVWRRFAPFERGGLAYVANRSDCVIVFNARVDWGFVPRHGLAPTWWRFCATVMHEWGHLRGMPYNWRNAPIHSNSPNNVMAWNEGLSARAWWWPYFPGCR